MDESGETDEIPVKEESKENVVLPDIKEEFDDDGDNEDDKDYIPHGMYNLKA